MDSIAEAIAGGVEVKLEMSEYSSSVQDIAETIKSILGLPVTMVDSQLRRIAGTGIYKDKIGTSVPNDCVFAKCVASGQPMVVPEPRVDRICLSCTKRDECEEEAEICMPICLQNAIVGVIAIFAETHDQRRELLLKSKQVLGFLRRMASLISKELYSQILYNELQREKKKLEITLDSISEGIVMIEREGRIVAHNRKAREYLSDRPFEVGSAITKVLPVSKSVIKELMAGELRQIAISTYNGTHYDHYICVPNPVRCQQEIDSVVLTIYPFNKVHKAISQVLHSGEGLSLSAIIGESEEVKLLREIVHRAACSDSTVLITGESGTGKELCARVIHNESTRGDEVFLAVNCAAIPESLIESELFGYEEGSFSGAKRGGKPGQFELANKGTIFLDEISEIPLHIQAKLLRVLQEREVTRIGGIRTNKVDVRIIAASNRDLHALLKEGRFREDLFYRLDVIPITVPPLRERREDIPMLAEQCIDRFNRIFGKTIQGIEPEALEAMRRYSWPGNVRELENVIEYGVNFVDGEYLGLRTIGPRLTQEIDEANSRSPLYCERRVIGEALPTGLHSPADHERKLISELLSRYGYGLEAKRKIARQLGVSQATIYRKIRKYQLVRSP